MAASHQHLIDSCVNEDGALKAKAIFWVQGTIARLSARLEGSLAKEAALKQRLQQLQASASRQLSASSTGLPSLGSVTSSQPAPQSHPEHVPHVQELIASQPEQQQQQEQGFRPSSAGHAAGRRSSVSTEGKTGRQEASSALEQELGAVKVSLARAESELRVLRRCAVSSPWVLPDWIINTTCTNNVSVPSLHRIQKQHLGHYAPALEGKLCIPLQRIIVQHGRR